MKFRAWHLIWALPLFLSLLIVLLGLIADAWLESSGGREMLQRELSRNLGMPVRLRGEFHIGLIPRLNITGTGLEIGQPDTTAFWVVCRKYAVAIELAPFIHREVRIASVELNGGNAGFADDAKSDLGGGNRLGASLVLPQVTALEISDFRLAPVGKDNEVYIEDLRITGFQPGKPAPVALNAGLAAGQQDSARLNLDGELTLANDLSMHMDILKMTFDWDGSSIEGLSGEWQWLQPAGAVKGRMDWDQAPHKAEVRLELPAIAELAGVLHVHYEQPPMVDSSDLSLDFSILPEVIVMRALELNLDGQSLRGQGCLLTAAKPSLRLVLQAADIDADRIYAMLPEQRGGNTELPLDLAVRISAGKARFSGAVATDAELSIGGQPECPSPNGSVR